MSIIDYNGQKVNVDEDDFLQDPEKWSTEMAEHEASDYILLHPKPTIGVGFGRRF